LAPLRKEDLGSGNVVEPRKNACGPEPVGRKKPGQETLRTLWTWLVTGACYVHILHWGVWVFVAGVIGRALTFPFDARRRVPQACAIALWGWAQFLTNPFWRVRVEGKEHLRGGGPFLVCCNHQSLLDSLAMLRLGHQVKFISHRKVFDAPLLGTMMRLCGYVAVDPGNPFPAPDVAREIGGWWELGESVCLYPEGTRSKDGELQPFKHGGFRLARNHRVPVLPVAIDGTHGILPKGAFALRGRVFHRITVRILPPIPPEQYGDDPIALAKTTHDVIEAALDDIRRPAAAGNSMIIIGGGVAGLAMGAYGQMNGFETRVLEQHTRAGGLVTGWRRKGYNFEGCLGQLVGSAPGLQPAWHQIWRELGVVQDREMVHHDETMRIEGPDGRTLHLYADLDRLQRHLNELSPADARVIAELCDSARKLSRCAPPILKPRELMGPRDGLDALRRFLPYFRLIRRYQRQSVEDFAARFEDPFVGQALTWAYDLPDFPMFTLMFSLGFQHNRMVGYPMGGSVGFAEGLERRYRELGGEVVFRSKVDEILVENDRAVGVRMADGSEERADIIVSAADGYSTIFGMLDGRYVDDQIREYYDQWPTFLSLVQVSLGVDRDFSDEHHRVLFTLDEPIVIAGEPHHRICVKHLCYEPSAAPPGKSVLGMMFACEYEPWAELAKDRAAYDAEKRRIADEVIARLDERYPGLADQVETVDVTTPMTYERYTSNWKGSMEGWLVTTGVLAKLVRGKTMRKTLPGLDGFYMIGHWVEPGGGVPAAALSGRNAVQLICHARKRPFVTTVP